MICGRCFIEVEELVESTCEENPEELFNQAIGMYHCPDCGTMLLAGVRHPYLCVECIEELK